MSNRFKVSSQSRKSEFRVFSIVQLRSTGSTSGGGFQIHFSPKPLKI